MSAVVEPGSAPVASTGSARSPPGSAAADRDENSVKLMQAKQPEFMTVSQSVN